MTESYINMLHTPTNIIAPGESFVPNSFVYIPIKDPENYNNYFTLDFYASVDGVVNVELYNFLTKTLVITQYTTSPYRCTTSTCGKHQIHFKLDSDAIICMRVNCSTNSSISILGALITAIHILYFNNNIAIYIFCAIIYYIMIGAYTNINMLSDPVSITPGVDEIIAHSYTMIDADVGITRNIDFCVMNCTGDVYLSVHNAVCGAQLIEITISVDGITTCDLPTCSGCGSVIYLRMRSDTGSATILGARLRA